MTARRIAGDGPCWDFAKKVIIFTYAEVAAATGKSYNSVVRIVRIWEEAGAVSTEKLDGSRRVQFRVINAGALQPAQSLSPTPRAESAEANMWTAMRMLTTFGPTDVAAHAATEATLVGAEAARDYCRALSRIGYLKTVRKAIPGTRDAIYRLLRNTGPRPPRIRRVRGVWDENLDQFMPLREAIG